MGISIRPDQLWKSIKISKTKDGGGGRGAAPGPLPCLVAGLVFIQDIHLGSECLFEGDASQSKHTSDTAEEKLTVRVYTTMSLMQDSGTPRGIAKVQDALGGPRPGQHLHYPDQFSPNRCTLGWRLTLDNWFSLDMRKHNSLELSQFGCSSQVHSKEGPASPPFLNPSPTSLKVFLCRPL